MTILFILLLYIRFLFFDWKNHYVTGLHGPALFFLLCMSIPQGFVRVHTFFSPLLYGGTYHFGFESTAAGVLLFLFLSLFFLAGGSNCVFVLLLDSF